MTPLSWFLIGLGLGIGVSTVFWSRLVSESQRTSRAAIGVADEFKRIAKEALEITR